MNRENNSHGSNSEKPREIFGIKVKTWTLIVLVTCGISFLVFILIPYIIATFAPLAGEGEAQDLVDLMDGTTLIVGCVGTVASAFSIAMTIADKRRYQAEKEGMTNLIGSVEVVHDELEDIADYVVATFEQNTRLGVALFENHVIKKNPNEVDVSTNRGRRFSLGGWSARDRSEEKP